jgi:hypothetical protein
MKKTGKWISEIGDYFVSIDPGDDLDSPYAKLWKAYGYPEYLTLMTEEETPKKEKIKTLNESTLKKIKS